MFVHRFVRIVGYLFCKLFFFIKCQGKANVPLMGGVIIASNHVSFLDPIVLGVIMPRITNFMAREDLFKNKLSAWFLNALLAFPVKRDKFTKEAIKKSLNILSSGKVLLMFPEGTRSKDGNIHKGEIGCIWLARMAKVLIVPVRIYGSYQAYPAHKWLISPYPIRVVCGEPFDVCRYKEMTDVDLIEILMKRIKNL